MVSWVYGWSTNELVSAYNGGTGHQAGLLDAAPRDKIASINDIYVYCLCIDTATIST